MSFSDYVTHLVNLSRLRKLHEKSVFQHSGEKINKFFCLVKGILPVFCPMAQSQLRHSLEHDVIPKLPKNLWKSLENFEEWKFSLETGLDYKRQQQFLEEFERLLAKIQKTKLKSALFPSELSFLFSIHSKFFHYFRFGMFTYEKVMSLQKGDVLGTLKNSQGQSERRVSSIFIWEPVVLCSISKRKYEGFCKTVAGNPFLYVNALLKDKDGAQEQKSLSEKHGNFAQVWSLLKENLNSSLIRKSYIHDSKNVIRFSRFSSVHPKNATKGALVLKEKPRIVPKSQVQNHSENFQKVIQVPLEEMPRGKQESQKKPLYALNKMKSSEAKDPDTKGTLKALETPRNLDSLAKINLKKNISQEKSSVLADRNSSSHQRVFSSEEDFNGSGLGLKRNLPGSSDQKAREQKASKLVENYNGNEKSPKFLNSFGVLEPPNKTSELSPKQKLPSQLKDTKELALSKSGSLSSPFYEESIARNLKPGGNQNQEFLLSSSLFFRKNANGSFPQSGNGKGKFALTANGKFASSRKGNTLRENKNAPSSESAKTKREIRPFDQPFWVSGKGTSSLRVSSQKTQSDFKTIQASFINRDINSTKREPLSSKKEASLAKNIETSNGSLKKSMVRSVLEKRKESSNSWASLNRVGGLQAKTDRSSTQKTLLKGPGIFELKKNQ